jgi:hypothetical protein
MLTREQKLVMLSTTLDMFLEGVFVTLSPISVQWPFVPGWAVSLLFIMMPIGTIIGNSTFGRLTDLRGRKLTYLSMLAVYAVGSALVILSSNVYELLAGLLIVYSAIGGEIPVVLSYVVESAPVDIKERVVVLITNVGNVGAVVAAALALVTSGVSVNSERLALGVLIGLAISVLVITRSLVPESRPWASLPRERRGRVSLGYESARFALASLTLMAISSVLTFGLLALSIGPEEFPSISNEILLVYFIGEVLGGFIAAYLVTYVGSKGFTLASYLGGLVTTVAAVLVLRLGPMPFLALLLVNGVFTETVWASRNVLESLAFPTNFRGTGISLVRIAAYVLLAASYLVTASMTPVEYLTFAAAMWALGVGASLAWYVRGPELVGVPLVNLPEEFKVRPPRRRWGQRGSDTG